MSNVMSLKGLRNKVSRNGFDLSERRSFTAKVGELLPCFVLETIPGDKISINPSHFTRTMPVNTAAYTKLREYVHYYYVPYRLLHCQADVFFSDNGDNPTRSESINSSKSVSKELPYITYNDILEYLRNVSKKQGKNVVGMDAAKSTVKLLEYLGYGDFSNFVFGDDKELNDNNPLANVRFSPFTLLAYQKIYQDHFRNQQWEKGSPYTCNIDYMTFGAKIPVPDLSKTLVANQLINDMFTMRYCDFNRDYFFGLLPNAQYGDEATFSVDYLQGQNKDRKDIDFVKLPDSLGGNQLLPKLSASILALRKAEALQKYKEIKQSGNHDYKTYLDKIFNVSVSDDRSDICRYLGGYNSEINISEVVNSALNGDEAIADIKGKGVSNGGAQSINFESREFGVIIGIYTCRPTLDYALNAPMRANMRVAYDDFANPVFDKIGMETITLDEVVTPYGLSKKYLLNPNNVRSALGYAPRYTSYKTSYDKVLGEFKRTLKSWVSPLSSDSVMSNFVYLPYVRPGSPLDAFKNLPFDANALFAASSYVGGEYKVNPQFYNQYVQSGVVTLERLKELYDSLRYLDDPSVSTPEGAPLYINDAVKLTYRNFKVSPSVVDAIFVQAADDDTTTDQLLINMSIGCPIVRNLDYDGLPY